MGVLKGGCHSLFFVNHLLVVQKLRVRRYAFHGATRTDDTKRVNTVLVFDMLKNKVFYFRSQCVKTLIISSHWCDPYLVWLMVFFFLLGVRMFVFFSQLRWELSPSVTHTLDNFYCAFCARILEFRSHQKKFFPEFKAMCSTWWYASEGQHIELANSLNQASEPCATL